MENLNYEQIISEIQELIKNKNFNKALEICELDIYKSVESIQSERLFILVRKKHDYVSAYNIWENFKDSNNMNIVINGINLLMGLNELEEAYSYVKEHNFDDIRYIRLKLKLLAQIGKMDEFLEIANDTKYAFDDVVKRLRYNLMKKNSNVDNEKIQLLTKIYLDDITKDEIKKSNLDLFEQSVLLTAYYEKYNPKAGIDFLKKLKKTDGLSNTYKKSYNTLLQRLASNKNKYFDITIYSDILNTKIDFNMISEYKERNDSKKQQVKEINAIKKVENVKEIPKKEITLKTINKKKSVEDNKIISIVGTRVNSRYANTNNSNIDNQNNNTNHVLLIKDVLKNEIDQIGMYLYVMMQDSDIRSKAIRAWDNLENMVYKPVTDKKTLEKLINILFKVSNDHPEIVDADSKKLIKLLNNNN